MFILLVFILFIAFSIFLYTSQKYTKSTLFMLLMGLSFLFVMSSIFIYLSKDAYYYNSLYSYFRISPTMQNQLMFLPISRHYLIRILNISSMLFLYFGLLSAIFFAFNVPARKVRQIMLLLAIPAVIQILLYDPSIYTYLYYGLYPNVMTSQSLAATYEIIHRITYSVNTLYVVVGISLFIYALYDAPKVRQIRSNILMILLCYISIQIVYYYINFWAPNILIAVSKAAHFIRYKPIILPGNPTMYTLLPYIATFCLIISLYGIYKYSRIHNNIKNQELVISRNIDSAVLTSRVFSHYMKNELLAIRAQTEFLEQMCEKSPDVVQEINVIEQRCRQIYERLDDVHRKTARSKLDLKPTSLYKLTEELLEHMQMELKNVRVNFTRRQPAPLIMADPYYFTQVIENLIGNAIDALENIPEKVRTIDLLINIKNKWVEFIIRDNGIGIPEENLELIFQPFFSSKPTSRSWGMGLSLCHSIITSHEGKMSVESRKGEGTAIHIIIPLIAVLEDQELEGELT